MDKKIKEQDSLDLLKEQYNYLIFRTWLSVIITCFFFIMGIVGINSGFEKNEKTIAVSFCFLAGLILLISLIMPDSRLKKLKREIERLEKEKKEKNEGIEEKQA